MTYSPFKLTPLYQEKIRLLDKFIQEMTRLREKYHWKADDPDDLLKLDFLAEELSRVDEKIDNLLEHGEGQN
jgi:hypothetical protein